jgi:hypothetical protein
MNALADRVPNSTKRASRERVEFTGAGGIRLAADTAGPVDGPPALLLHGGGQTL